VKHSPGSSGGPPQWLFAQGRPVASSSCEDTTAAAAYEAAWRLSLVKHWGLESCCSMLAGEPGCAAGSSEHLTGPAANGCFDSLPRRPFSGTAWLRPGIKSYHTEWTCCPSGRSVGGSEDSSWGSALSLWSGSRSCKPCSGQPGRS